ncbi:peptidoglycan amidohydrolase family protein [Enterococcus sp. LJL128]
MASIETALNWMGQRSGKVTYSMAARGGPSSYDCSSAVYFALIAGGFLSAGLMGNTDSLFGHLEAAGWKSVATPQRGDVFIWGNRGASSGAAGHTGIFTDASNIIHCNFGYNGITVNTYSSIWNANGNPPATIYRAANADSEPVPDDPTPSPENLQNAGTLDYLGIKNGYVEATGWHYSSGKDIQEILFINAVTGQEIKRIKTEIIDRPDVKEEYPNVEGVEKSGFDVRIKVENGTAVYVVGIRSSGSESDRLIFDKIIIFEQAFDIEIDHYASTNEKFFLEIISKGKVVKRVNKILNTLSWTNELMFVPDTRVDLPIEYAEFIEGHEEMKIFINHKVFHGIIIGYELDKEREIITVDLMHVISEWEYRQISTNLAAKNRTVNDLYSTLDFRYQGWNIEYLQDSASRVIDYVYSRQNKLEGLTKTCELTDDLFWRVGFHFGRSLEIGVFGDKKPYTLSTKPSSDQNIRIITEPTIIHKFDNVINVATVYGEKSDSGMSSMSLREIQQDKSAQDSQFPVVILKKGVNNERDYDYVEFTKLAPNNELEYSVIDSESIALESGKVIEGSFSFNDLAPFNTDSEEITDEDRAKAAKTAYDAAVKKLKQARRSYQIELTTERLPADIEVGDKIRLLYDNQLLMIEECSNYMKKILSLDDWFYITRIDYIFDQSGVEHNRIVLEKFLKIDRESDPQ